jgi:hypothetical protein
MPGTFYLLQRRNEGLFYINRCWLRAEFVLLVVLLLLMVILMVMTLPAMTRRRNFKKARVASN